MRLAALALAFALLAQPASASGIEAAALVHLVERARATHSSALVVIAGGRVIESDNFAGSTAPILAMSVAKSFCSLAQPIGHFVPEWENDARQSITLRDTLAMTTGLADPFATNFSIDGDTRAARGAITTMRST